MKKLLSLLLAIFMIVGVSACGDTTDGEIKKPEGSNTETQGNGVSAEDVTVTETVLVDESGVKITAKSLDVDGFMGPELKLFIENNSGKDLTFQSRKASVNGYMVDTMMSVDVVNGKQANDSLTFMNGKMELAGIEVIANMEFSFHIFTTEDWETYLDTQLIQLNTSVADTYEQTYDASGEVAHEAEGLKIVVKGLSEDDILGSSIIVYIENNTGEDVTVQARDVSLNGLMVDPVFSCEVGNGKHAVDTITFLSSDLEENEITEIQNAELSFHVFTWENLETSVDTEAITITF